MMRFLRRLFILLLVILLLMVLGGGIGYGGARVEAFLSLMARSLCPGFPRGWKFCETRAAFPTSGPNHLLTLCLPRVMSRLKTACGKWI